jgi:hypothetical protein
MLLDFDWDEGTVTYSFSIQPTVGKSVLCVLSRVALNAYEKDNLDRISFYDAPCQVADFRMSWGYNANSDSVVMSLCG